MSLFDPRTVVRASLSTVAAVLIGLALAACSSPSDTSTADTATEQDSAPVLGGYDDRIQLVEDTPYTFTTDDGDSFVLEITAYDDEEPGGDGQDHLRRRCKRGNHRDAGGSAQGRRSLLASV